VKSEIKSRQLRIKVLGRNLKRLQKTLSQFNGRAVATAGNNSAQELYRKRLVDKKTFEASIASSIDASATLSALEANLDMGQAEVDGLAASIDTLKVLLAKLEGKSSDEPVGQNSDLLLLTKQALDSRAALQTATEQLKSTEENLVTLADSKTVIARQIATLEASPLARAANKQVDVLFVPYSNLSNYQPGTALYTCRLTVFLCSKAGVAGQTLSGETSYVHPFFGKPIRGVFVEVQLNNPDAAAREIIHAARAPFFL
jgi:hypothetical protein